MKLFGLEITKRIPAAQLSPVDNRGGWFPIIRESFPGAWQRNIEITTDCALAFSAVYACITLISSDIAKLPIKLIERQQDGIWKEIKNTIAPVLKKPNGYQNRIKFIEQWLISKLARGNAYILKERDGSGKIVALYVLDPSRVTVLVSPDGSVFYQLQGDNLSGLEEAITVPASEIIHDMMPALFHPLVGVSPIFACGLATLQGLNIQKNSANFFANMSRPSGLLTAPGAISDAVAVRLKEAWEENYSGHNLGKLAVLGDGLKYEAMTINAQDAQLIEQLKWTAENVCSCFHVPAYKVGFAVAPTYNNAEIFNQIYYSDCLQSLIENIELCLDEGLGLTEIRGREVACEFNLDGLLRMDTQTRYKSHSDAIGGGWLSPNEARNKEDLQAVEGGDTPYLQQQNWSLSALARRDSMPIPELNAPALPDMTEELSLEWNQKFMDTIRAGFV